MKYLVKLFFQKLRWPWNLRITGAYRLTSVRTLTEA